MGDFISESQFRDLYNSHKVRLQQIINLIIRDVDYDNVIDYKFNHETGGVYILRNGKWSWSWLNTINTNYSCLYLLLKHVNDNFSKTIRLIDFMSFRLDQTFKHIQDSLYYDKQKIFTPNSKIFFDLYNTSQKTWNIGLISTISALSTISKFYSVEQMGPNYERGLIDDMKGVDMVLNIDGKPLKNQHKSCDVSLFGDFYESKRFIYNEKTYRYNVDTLTIDCGNEIHFFRNSTDKNLIDRIDGKLQIHKSLWINTMKKEKNDMVGLLTELNKICFDKKIEFIFEIDESNENKIVTDNEGKILTLYLNNVNDEKLTTLLNQKIKELQQLLN